MEIDVRLYHMSHFGNIDDFDYKAVPEEEGGYLYENYNGAQDEYVTLVLFKEAWKDGSGWNTFWTGNVETLD